MYKEMERERETEPRVRDRQVQMKFEYWSKRSQITQAHKNGLYMYWAAQTIDTRRPTETKSV
jgi:hypothetical protein